MYMITFKCYCSFPAEAEVCVDYITMLSFRTDHWITLTTIVEASLDNPSCCCSVTLQTVFPFMSSAQ